jgi:hypothetical protein
MNTTTKTPATIEAEIMFDDAANPLNPNNTLRLTFVHGRVLSVRVGDLTPTVIAQALMHGLKQKHVDAGAIARNPETGRSATVEDKYQAVLEVYERLTTGGGWNKGRAEGSGASGGLLLRALMQHTGKDRDAIKAFLNAKTDAECAALRKNPKIAAIIATLKPEAKPDASIDTDAMLDEARGLA